MTKGYKSQTKGIYTDVELNKFLATDKCATYAAGLQFPPKMFSLILAVESKLIQSICFLQKKIKVIRYYLRNSQKFLVTPYQTVCGKEL